jgi:hypothetical protein
MPVFGGGTSRFQPVYAGDIARVIEICTRAEESPRIARMIEGKVIGAGGPEGMLERSSPQLNGRALLIVGTCLVT